MGRINKLFEKVKVGGKKLIIPITLTTLLTASAQEARADLKKVWQEIKDRTSIEASYSYSKPDPLKDFYKQMNEDWRNGKYTMNDPVLKDTWKDIESPKTLTMPGIGINFKVWENKNKGLTSYLTAVYQKGSADASCSEVYQGTNTRIYPISVVRNENYKLTKPKVGVKIEKKLSDKVSVSGSANLDFYNVSGNANTTLYIRGTPENVTGTTYVQERKAERYSGNAKGFSAEVDCEYKLGKNVSVGAGLGYRKASVSTSGKEESRSNIGTYVASKEYNPDFDFTGINGKVKIKVSF